MNAIKSDITGWEHNAPQKCNNVLPEDFEFTRTIAVVLLREEGLFGVLLETRIFILGVRSNASDNGCPDGRDSVSSLVETFLSSLFEAFLSSAPVQISLFAVKDTS